MASCSGNFDIFTGVVKYLANKNGAFVRSQVCYSEALNKFNIIESVIEDEDEVKDRIERVSS